MSQPGEIWVADVLFTNGQASKRRPVLVLWRDASDAIVAAITSSSPRGPSDVVLKDWAKSGLRAPSTVRLLRLDSFQDDLLIAHIGTVSRRDAKSLNAAWAKHLRLNL
ncbi:MAG TPA: type II toxin-antitoxin system PemK/MazF family toxin [Tepidiformaceae bacterium]|nr:type II toxin-antitoxin system PemK/MazF family toxin [Tepidiformaceae bacterium]